MQRRRQRCMTCFSLTIWLILLGFLAGDDIGQIPREGGRRDVEVDKTVGTVFIVVLNQSHVL
ncbi:hypothetical protein Hanom_Chr05g00398891 [Helianthus anomalus]